MTDQMLEMRVNPFRNDLEDRSERQSQNIESVAHESDAFIREVTGLFDTSKMKYTGLPSLSPAQIDTVQMRFFDPPNNWPQTGVNEYLKGIFISSLIQQSYKTLGNKEFFLTVRKKYASCLPWGLKFAHPVRITIVGYAGANAGGNTRNCELVCEGDAVCGLGYLSKKSTFIAKGNVAYDCGAFSRKCMYVIYGDVGTSLGRKARKCVFTVYGDIQASYVFEGAKRCVLKTPNESTYSKAWWMMERSGKNMLQLTDAEGNVLEEVKR